LYHFLLPRPPPPPLFPYTTLFRSSINDVVSCPGMDYCSLAITRSMGMAERIHAHLGAHPESRNGFAERLGPFTVKISGARRSRRSEEHTSELQSLAYLVCRLLLEK